MFLERPNLRVGLSQLLRLADRTDLVTFEGLFVVAEVPNEQQRCGVTPPDEHRHRSWEVPGVGSTIIDPSSIRSDASVNGLRAGSSVGSNRITCDLAPGISMRSR